MDTFKGYVCVQPFRNSLRESVRIAFLLAGLNDVEVSACDISGAYLNAPVGEKVWFVAGTEMGQNKEIAMVITRALSGLKTSAKVWSEFFGKSLHEMGYASCVADPDVWMKPATNNEGYKY